MALTSGTTLPIVPYSMRNSGGQSGNVASLPYTSSSAIRKGDVLILTSGLAVSDDDAQADGVILGVALEAKASVASLGFDDQVLVALALPGAIFAGSFVAGAATDYTANAAAAITATTHDTVLGTDSYTGYLLVNQADTTGGQCRVFQFANEQLNGKTLSFGGTNIVNPRVLFTFRSSAFQPLV